MSIKIGLRREMIPGFKPENMVYLMITAVAALFGLFLALPFIRGGAPAMLPDKENTKEEKAQKAKNDALEQLADRIESTKLALRDLDMENKIGKIAPGDFEALKSELLEEWAEAEELYKEAQAGQTGGNGN